MKDPRVSVVIPCYNHGEFVIEAVDSALEQTCPPFEVIIVDDGSDDPGTRTVLDGIEHPCVTVIRTENRGLPAARNRGIDAASGEFILPLDADDRIAPTYLAQAVEILSRNPDVGIVYGLVELFGERSGTWQKPPFSETLLLFENMIVACALFRKRDWERVGGYCEKMTSGWEDWDFWLSLVERGYTAECLPEVMFYYRIRAQTMTTGMSLGQKMAMGLLIVWHHKGLYLRNYRTCFARLLSPFHREVPSPR